MSETKIFYDREGSISAIRFVFDKEYMESNYILHHTALLTYAVKPKEWMGEFITSNGSILLNSGMKFDIINSHNLQSKVKEILKKENDDEL